MSAKQRVLAYYLVQAVLFLSVVAFALYQFKRHTPPQPIYFANAENDLKAGRESAARKEFDDALRQRPSDPTAYVSVIQTCFSQKRPTLAGEYAQRAIEACRQQPPEVRSAFYGFIADAYSEIDQPPHQQRAIAATKQALDLMPDNHVMENQYGYLLADNASTRGPDVDMALVVLKRALDGIKKGPTSVDEAQLVPAFTAMTEDSYGWALYKNEQYPDALTTLTQALEDYPKNTSGEMRKVSYYHLGMAYVKLGRKDQAANAFNSALAYDAKYNDALTALASLSTASSAGSKAESAASPRASAPIDSSPGSTNSSVNLEQKIRKSNSGL